MLHFFSILGTVEIILEITTESTNQRAVTIRAIKDSPTWIHPDICIFNRTLIDRRNLCLGTGVLKTIPPHKIQMVNQKGISLSMKFQAHLC